MKKSLIYLFSLLCMLTLVTSCSDDEKGGTDDAWKEISKEYTSGITANGLSTSGTVNVNAASADKATIILNNCHIKENRYRLCFRRGIDCYNL